MVQSYTALEPSASPMPVAELGKWPGRESLSPAWALPCLLTVLIPGSELP